MVWSGSRPACLPLPFICLPVLFICLPGWVLVVGFPAGLSPTSFHLSPTSFQLSPSSFHLSPRLGACGRFPAGLSPTSFHLSPSSFICLPGHFLSFVSNFFHCLPGWCLWSGSRPACLPLPFICLPLLFICLPGWVVGFRPACLPLPFICLPLLVCCGRVPGRVVSHFLLFVSHFFSFVSRLGACGRVPGRLVSHLLSFVSWFFSFFVGFPAGLSPTSLNVFPLLFICLSGWVLVVRFPAWLVSHFLAFLPFPFYLSPASFHLSPRLGACSPVSGRLVSHFLAFVFHFSPNSLLLGVLNSFLRRVRPLCHCWCPPISTGHVTFLFIRLPGLSLLVPALSAGHAAFLFMCLPGLSLMVSAHFRWSRSISFLCLQVCHCWRCNISIHLSPRSVTCGVHPFPLGMQHFYSFVSQVCHC